MVENNFLAPFTISKYLSPTVTRLEVAPQTDNIKDINVSNICWTMLYTKVPYLVCIWTLFWRLSIPPPENSIIFEVDRVTCKGTKSLPVCSYLISVTRFCPYGVGDTAIMKLKFRKSSKSQFLLLYVKDCTIPGEKAVIWINCNTEAQTPDQEKAFSLSSDSTLLNAFPSLQHFLTITDNINTKHSDCTLSTLTFDSDSTFSADEAAMICKISSDFAKEDNTISVWYAWVIYNVIQQM
ncbi:hypothetical protein EDD85DRAFT_794179 [Armillaria nabsnona]|nr:hypothetical protein EDD85DRAFT_794179 [Armillaria nabsnona]